MNKIFVAAAVLLVVGMSACTQFQRASNFTKDRIDGYCDSTTPLERETLRGQLAYPDGSPRVIVHCEPHGGLPE